MYLHFKDWWTINKMIMKSHNEKERTKKLINLYDFFPKQVKNK